MPSKRRKGELRLQPVPKAAVGPWFGVIATHW